MKQLVTMCNKNVTVANLW